MVLALALLPIRPGQTAEFEAAFAEALPLLTGMQGYVRHELQRSVDDDHRYALLVWWNTVEDHTVGFRHSSEYELWRAQLLPFYFFDPFPTVEHFVSVPS